MRLSPAISGVSLLLITYIEPGAAYLKDFSQRRNIKDRYKRFTN